MDNVPFLKSTSITERASHIKTHMYVYVHIFKKKLFNTYWSQKCKF